MDGWMDKWMDGWMDGGREGGGRLRDDLAFYLNQTKASNERERAHERPPQTTAGAAAAGGREVGSGTARRESHTPGETHARTYCSCIQNADISGTDTAATC